MNDSSASDELLYFNGVDGSTGQYFTAPMSSAEVVKQFVVDIPVRESRNDLKSLKIRRAYKKGSWGVTKGDPSKLEEVGWGVIFADDASPEVRKALQPLLVCRHQQAGKLYREFWGNKEKQEGYHRGEGKVDFLTRRGASAGPVDPRKMPYYLLIVGSPHAIPYQFQYLLDVEYAVGRIDFDTPAAYAQYARSVIEAEENPPKQQRTAYFFAPQHEDDPPTEISVQHLVEPLIESLRSEAPDWKIEKIVGAKATKDRLCELMGGKDTPAVLFTASHGLALQPGDPRRLREQGALICQEWPGTKAWGKQALPARFYFSGSDLQADAQFGGMIVFMFACYSGGTPLPDAVPKSAPRNTDPSGAQHSAVPMLPQAFTSDLPKRLLAHPQSGALAVIAHVDRALPHSFIWKSAPAAPQLNSQTQIFEAALRELLAGMRVGQAMEFFNHRYADIGIELNELRSDKLRGVNVPDDKLAWLWMVSSDARNYIVLGDPAVRLPAARSEGDTRK